MIGDDEPEHDGSREADPDHRRATGHGADDGGGASPRPPGSIVRMGLLFYGAMGIAALLWRMSTPGDSILFPSPEAQARAWSLPAAIGVGVGAWP